MPEILIYDDIGGGWFGGITAGDFRAELQSANAADGERVTVRINSAGGSVFEGIAMAHAIRDNAKPVDVIVDGLAASIASVIAIAGASVVMAEDAYMMTHAPWAPAVGTADDHRAVARQLEALSGTMANAYARRTGAARDVAAARFLEGENWFDAGEAVAEKLIDSIEPATGVAASLDVSGVTWFENAPGLVRSSTLARSVASFERMQRKAHRLDAMNKRVEALTAE